MIELIGLNPLRELDQVKRLDDQWKILLAQPQLKSTINQLRRLPQYISIVFLQKADFYSKNPLTDLQHFFGPDIHIFWHAIALFTIKEFILAFVFLCSILHNYCYMFYRNFLPCSILFYVFQGSIYHYSQEWHEWRAGRLWKWYSKERSCFSKASCTQYHKCLFSRTRIFLMLYSLLSKNLTYRKSFHIQ